MPFVGVGYKIIQCAALKELSRLTSWCHAPFTLVSLVYAADSLSLPPSHPIQSIHTDTTDGSDTPTPTMSSNPLYLQIH